MMRILLLAALIAVGYDAYALQGETTRRVIDTTVEGVSRLGDALPSAANRPAAPAQPS